MFDKESMRKPNAEDRETLTERVQEISGSAENLKGIGVFAPSNPVATIKDGEFPFYEKVDITAPMRPEVIIDNGRLGNSDTVDGIQTSRASKPAPNTLVQVDELGKAPFSTIAGAGAIPTFANNAAAVLAGLSVGAFYRNGDNLLIVH